MRNEIYDSPLGGLVLAADVEGLAGAWFAGQRHYGEFGSVRHALDDAADATPDAPALREARVWLDAYFAGEHPGELPPLHLMGTSFQQRVWQLLLEIPYGQTTTYGALARELEHRFGSRASARAVGGAVGRNPVSIIVPCHRVLGANGAITGYAGGVDRKRALLKLEGAAIA